MTYTKEGKQYCPKCKAIRDEMLKGAFVECYQILCRQNRDLVDAAIDETFDMLSNENIENGITELRKKLGHQKLRKERLLDRALLNSVSNETFDKKTALIDAEINNLKNRISYLEDESKSREEKRKQLKRLKKEIHEGGIVTEFSRATFESLVQEVIVGGYDKDGEPQPHKLTFILKTDEEITIDGRKHAPQRKNAAGCCCDDVTEIFHFAYYTKHFKFDKCETGMRKKLVDSVNVSVAIPQYHDPLSIDGMDT